MIVAADMQLAIGTATGIGEYQRGLLCALREEGVRTIGLQAPWLDPWRFDRRVAWDQVLLPIAAARSGADVLHATSGTMPLILPLPTVVTVHDVAWLRVQRHTRAYARAYFGAFMAARYRAARAIVVDSEFSRRELLGLVPVDPALVSVVYPGVDARIGRLLRAPSEEPVALAVGTVERRKNLLTAIEAVARVPGVRLVSVGPPTPYAEECRARVAELGIEDRIVFRGYVPDEELSDLYEAAAVALVPSRYEGFGYAVAQALCAGVPVIVAATSSLVEVTGGSGALLDPDDIDGWTAVLAEIVNDRDRSQRRADAVRSLSIERFAWSTAARRLAQVYGSIHG